MNFNIKRIKITVLHMFETYLPSIILWAIVIVKSTDIERKYAELVDSRLLLKPKRFQRGRTVYWKFWPMDISLQLITVYMTFHIVKSSTISFKSVINPSLTDIITNSAFIFSKILNCKIRQYSSADHWLHDVS